MSAYGSGAISPRRKEIIYRALGLSFIAHPGTKKVKVLEDEEAEEDGQVVDGGRGHDELLEAPHVLHRDLVPLNVLVLVALLALAFLPAHLTVNVFFCTCICTCTRTFTCDCSLTCACNCNCTCTCIFHFALCL